ALPGAFNEIAFIIVEVLAIRQKNGCHIPFAKTSTMFLRRVKVVGHDSRSMAYVCEGIKNARMFSSR
ncbi:MAG: hypothetical protein NC248_12255, partial [Bacteroides sp.]|nr:hypothetical protein [Bacteroides sp.]